MYCLVSLLWRSKLYLSLGVWFRFMAVPCATTCTTLRQWGTTVHFHLSHKVRAQYFGRACQLFIMWYILFCGKLPPPFVLCQQLVKIRASLRIVHGDASYVVFRFVQHVGQAVRNRSSPCQSCHATVRKQIKLKTVVPSFIYNYLGLLICFIRYNERTNYLISY